MTRLLIHTSGKVKTYAEYAGLSYSEADKTGFLLTRKVIEIPAQPPAAQPPENIRISNAFRLPVTDADGKPVMQTAPGLEAEPRTVGEYDALHWLCVDKRNPASVPLEALAESALRRIHGLDTGPYVFVQTEEWLQYFPG